MKPDDEFWMQRCLMLATKGIGYVSPNPLVGAVIVKNWKMIGEGYHARYGSAHAEINAINNALKNKHRLTGATMYVNLEPCFHYGNTPPCVDALIKYNVARVVIGTKDPNPLVAGESITKLRKNGIACTIGVLKEDAKRLNEKFFTYITKQRPFVAIKAAQTFDGFIAREDGSSKWITNKRSRIFTHQLRSEYDAVVVGANTVIRDDPALTVRHIKGKNPVRVVIDGRLRVPLRRKIFSGNAPTVVYTSVHRSRKQIQKVKRLENKGIVVVQIPGKNAVMKMQSVLTDLWDHGISSVMVEGGQQMYTAFINEGLADKIYLFTATKTFGSGIRTFSNLKDQLKGKIIAARNIGNDEFQEIDIS